MLWFRFLSGNHHIRFEGVRFGGNTLWLEGTSVLALFRTSLMGGESSGVAMDVCSQGGHCTCHASITSIQNILPFDRKFWEVPEAFSKRWLGSAYALGMYLENRILGCHGAASDYHV